MEDDTILDLLVSFLILDNQTHQKPGDETDPKKKTGAGAGAALKSEHSRTILTF